MFHCSIVIHEKVIKKIRRIRCRYTIPLPSHKSWCKKPIFTSNQNPASQTVPYGCLFRFLRCGYKIESSWFLSSNTIFRKRKSKRTRRTIEEKLKRKDGSTFTQTEKKRERENGRGGKASQNKSVQRNELTLLVFLSATKDRIEKK